MALPLLVGCQATGVITAVAQIAVSPPVVDFGTVPLQSSSQREVVISNTGAAPLSIASITLTPTGSAFACEGCRAQTLQPQEQATVTIRFTPADASPAVGRLAVVSNAPNAPEVLVSLAGNGGPSSSCTKETDAAFCKRLGRTCGAVTAPDNCGAMRTVPSCGTCTAPALCGNSNVCGCTAETDDALCLAHGVKCGPLTVTDRCGATRVITSCGMCANEHDTCGGAGTPGQCGCTPDSDAALCSRFNRNCGAFTVTDTCGTSRTIASCGTCTGPQTCGASNVCGCVAETDEALCARKGYVCGQLTATDNCGATRIVNSCGTCTNPVDTCGGGGTKGVCGCTPETDAQLCAKLSKACGAATTTDRCGDARSVASCGVCSAAPAHGSPLCTTSTLGAASCDFTCDDGYLKTGNTCSIACVGSSLTRTPFVAGTGTTDNPYLICTAAQLDRVRDFSTANFRLLGNVDLAGLPFEPIADATSQTFSGVFDGGGFRVLNWHYSAPAADHVGLFEKLTGSVKALRLVGFEVTGHDNVGVLAGSGSGTITDVLASASTVTGHDLVGGLTGTHTWLMTGCVADVTVNGHSFVGGLVGYETGWIDSSSATGAVTSTGERAGGLVGMIYGSSSVYSVYRSFATGDVNGVDAVGGLLGEGAKSNTSVGTSYATGSVTGTSNVGGLVGLSNVPITNSFSAGSVTGVSAVGGLVGANNSLIGHCYSRGAVTGTTGVGGLVGTNSTAPLALAADSFWDTTVSGQTTSAVGIGKTTTELFDANTYLRWNKYTTWRVGGAYPSFASEPATCVVGPSAFSAGAGTEASPYLITEPGQLYHIGCNLGSAYKLANDLDFNGHPMVPPIGDQSNSFSGTFDGNGKTIANWVSYGGSSALFAAISGTVHDVALSNVEVGGSTGVAALANNLSGSVTKVRSSGVVRGVYVVGGLVANAYGPISRSSSSATVVAGTGNGGASAYVGGLVGYAGGTVSNCFATGTVNSLDLSAGGLIGVAVGGANLINSYSTGAVTKGSGLSSGNTSMATGCYWDIETSGQTKSVYGTGKTTAEMKTPSTYSGWDFTNIWQVDAGSYPTLR